MRKTLLSFCALAADRRRRRGAAAGPSEIYAGRPCQQHARRPLFRGSMRCARISRRRPAARRSISGSAARFSALPARTVLAAQAAWLRRHPEVVVRVEGYGDTRRHARPRARDGCPARRGGPRLSAAAGRPGGAGLDHQLGQGAAGPRPRRHDSRPLIRRRGAGSRSSPSQARAWRWASAISRAVISQAISARHSWPRVQPDSAARLNHLCASMRSTANSAAAGRIGHSKFEQRIDVSGFGVGKAAPKQEFRALLANCPHFLVPSVPGEGKFVRERQRNG